MLVILNVVYVLLAIGMIALILMQRGAGAQAGSGFGAGASATVFGASGASNFLSKSTKWLAIVFMSTSMFMAWHATRSSAPAPVQQQQDLGLMAELPAAPATPAPGDSVPAAPAQAPATGASQPVEATDGATPEPAPDAAANEPPPGSDGG